MKPDFTNVEEIVERHLPVASADEARAAGVRVWRRLQTPGASELDVRLHRAEPAANGRWRGMGLAAAAALVLAAAVGTAIVWRQAETALYRVVEGAVRQGETIRSNGGGGAVLVLAERSRIEMRSDSELSLERVSDGIRIRLSSGGIIVNAAKQRTGHLYVQTKDMTVSVVGTVFLVNAEEQGSRVAVIEGEVQVQQGAAERKLRPGEQVASTPSMPLVPVVEEISWSRNKEAHMALLQNISVPQVSAPAPPPQRLKFEAASIRPQPGLGGSFACQGADGVLLDTRMTPPRMTPAAPRGRCRGAADLQQLTGIAYDVPRRFVSGLPGWGNDPFQKFQVDAKAEDVSTVTKEQLRLMLRSLLEDRFKLQVRTETKESVEYVLVTTKGGARLKEWVGDEERAHQDGMNFDTGEMTVKAKSTMKDLADYLLPLLNSTVYDRTGLSGMFEYTVILHPVAGEPLPATVPAVAARGGRRTEFPTLSKDLEEQLGLSLQRQKVQYQAIVATYAETPSEN